MKVIFFWMLLLGFLAVVQMWCAADITTTEYEDNLGHPASMIGWTAFCSLWPALYLWAYATEDLLPIKILWTKSLNLICGMTSWNEPFGVFNESAITYFSVAFQCPFLFWITPHVRFMGGINDDLACYHLLFFN